MQRNIRRDTVSAFAGIKLLPHRLRNRVLGLDPLLRIAPGATLMSGIEFTGRGEIRVGNSYINSRCLIDGTGSVRIGDRALVAHGVKVLTATHEPGPSTQRGRAPIGLTTVIDDGVWVGAGAVILPGVHVGRGCVIAAGAVVTRDCLPDGLYAGVPAERKRDLPVDEHDAEPAAAGPVSPTHPTD